jgi:hypothetical protein
MIELDLKGAGWLGRALAAVACHRQWRSVRRASGFTSPVSKAGAGISRRAMRLSVRHLSGLIYDVVDDFVRGPIRDQRAQPLLPKPDALQKPRRRRPIVLARFSRRVRKRSLTLDDLCRRRNLANAASTISSVAVGTSNRPIDGGSVGPFALHLQGATQELKYSGCWSLHPTAAPPTSVAGAHFPMATRRQARACHPKSHQNHDVAVAARDMMIGNVASQCCHAKGAGASRRSWLVSL